MSVKVRRWARGGDHERVQSDGGSPRYNVLGIDISATSYADVVRRVVDAAAARKPLKITALAVHGLIEGFRDAQLGARLNDFDIVTPDGQPIRWALRLLYRKRLDERVYGPWLMLRVCEAARDEGLSIFLYGSTPEILEELNRALLARFPGLVIAGQMPSKFGRVSEPEFKEICKSISAGRPDILFCGLGCPRQEHFVADAAKYLSIPLLAVGAAFEYNAGCRKEPNEILMRLGLQWLHRLLHDPRRLWRRYLVTNTLFVLHCVRQFVSRRPPVLREASPDVFAGWA